METARGAVGLLWRKAVVCLECVFLGLPPGERDIGVRHVRIRDVVRRVRDLLGEDVGEDSQSSTPLAGAGIIRFS